jgi:hypothetical protein
MRNENFLANLKFITIRKCNPIEVLKADIPDKIQTEAIQTQNLKLNFHLIDLDKVFAN